MAAQHHFHRKPSRGNLARLALAVLAVSSTLSIAACDNRSDDYTNPREERGQMDGTTGELNQNPDQAPPAGSMTNEGGSTP